MKVGHVQLSSTVASISLIISAVLNIDWNSLKMTEITDASVSYIRDFFLAEHHGKMVEIDPFKVEHV